VMAWCVVPRAVSPHSDKRQPGRCGTRRLGAGWRVSDAAHLPIFQGNFASRKGRVVQRLFDPSRINGLAVAKLSRKTIG